jgi:hypothetical protein
MAGEAAVGDNRHELLHVHHGAGANGKTKFGETIATALGDYAAPAIAARVSSQADPGRCSAGLTVRDLVAGSGVAFEERGARMREGADRIEVLGQLPAELGRLASIRRRT